MRAVAPPSDWADPVTVEGDQSVLRRWLPLLVWLGCLLVAIVLLRWLGVGRLAVPPLTDPVAWLDWARTGDPVTVAMAAFRVVALGLAWYLTGVTSISVVARVLEAASLVRVADALSVGPVRVLVQQAVGVGLAASVLATAVPTAAPSGRASPAAADEVAVMVPIDAEAEASARADLALRDPAPAPVPAPDDEAAVDAPPAASIAPGGPTDIVSAAVQRQHRVQAGDHFWAIAEQEVARHLGRPGTESEVLDHWEALLEANADRLTVAGNADLLVPGQVLVLPEVAEVTP